MRSFGKGQAPQDEGYAEAASRLHEACAELISMRTRAAYAELLAAGLEVGLDYADRYALAKRRAGAGELADRLGRAVGRLEKTGTGEGRRQERKSVWGGQKGAETLVLRGRSNMK